MCQYVIYKLLIVNWKKNYFDKRKINANIFFKSNKFFFIINENENNITKMLK